MINSFYYKLCFVFIMTLTNRTIITIIYIYRNFLSNSPLRNWHDLISDEIFSLALSACLHELPSCPSAYKIDWCFQFVRKSNRLVLFSLKLRVLPYHHQDKADKLSSHNESHHKDHHQRTPQRPLCFLQDCSQPLYTCHWSYTRKE